MAYGKLNKNENYFIQKCAFSCLFIKKKKKKTIFGKGFTKCLHFKFIRFSQYKQIKQHKTTLKVQHNIKHKQVI